MNKGIRLDERFDLLVEMERNDAEEIVSGLVVGEVTAQNQRTILMAEKGEIKEAPLMGVGVASFLDDDNSDRLFREIRMQLKADRQDVKQIRFSATGQLEINAGYENT